MTVNIKGYAVLVDDEDYELVKKYNWYIHVSINKKRAYARYAKIINGKQIFIHLHREIIKCDIEHFVDHINGNTLDNRKSNLRICTKNENNKNRAKQNGSSKYKGVSWASKQKKWKAQIQSDNVKIGLGYYENEYDAYIAYSNASKKLHKQYSREILLPGL